MTEQCQLGRAACLAALVVCAVGVGGCKKEKWIKGKWLHIDEAGKPGMCHSFGEKRKLEVFRSLDCTGPPDPMLSGKWQLKKDTQLAILRAGEGEAKLVAIGERDDAHFTARAALAGTFHRLEAPKKAKALVDKLRQSGEVKLQQLSDADGCKQLNLSIDRIRKLPVEPKPRMLRSRDQGLEYHVDTATGDPTLQKIVYAINQDQLDWVGLHLSAAAFEAPGPTARLEGKLGKPEKSLTTGKGEARQHIVMWRGYCADVRGAYNKDVDVTLFATPGQRQGLYYLSDGVVADVWEDLAHTIATSPADDEPEQEQGSAGSAPAAAAPAAAPAPAAKPAAASPVPAPAKPEPAKAAAPKPAAPAAAPEPAAKPVRAGEKPSGQLAVPGDEDI